MMSLLLMGVSKDFHQYVSTSISASTFSGRIVLFDYLTSTGSMVYNPEAIKIDHAIDIFLRNGTLLDLKVANILSKILKTVTVMSQICLV